MRVYFARHGQSEANILRVISNRGWKHPLTDLGRAQAQALAERLTGEGITHIISSPVMRAVQTAEILASALGLPFTTAEALRENDNGSLEGRSDQAAWQEYDRAVTAWINGDEAARIADGESLLDCRNRFVPFIRGLITAHPAQSDRILLVAHGGLYRAVLPDVLENIDKPFSWSHPLENAGMVVSEARAGQLVCLAWDGADLGSRKGEYARLI